MNAKSPQDCTKIEMKKKIKTPQNKIPEHKGRLWGREPDSNAGEPSWRPKAGQCTADPLSWTRQFKMTQLMITWLLWVRK